MRCKTSVLGGTGLAAIAGALILAASTAAMAQTSTATTPATGPATQSMQQQSPSTSSTTSAATKPLSGVTNPSTTLASATVKDASGQSVGQVQTVKTSPSGKPTAVAVSLTASGGSSKVVSIEASKLSYDPNDKSLKSSLTLSEIQQLPTIQSP